MSLASNDTTPSNDVKQSDSHLSRREAVGRLAGAGLCACCAGLASGCPGNADDQESDNAKVALAAPRAPAGLQPVIQASSVPLDLPILGKIGDIPLHLVRKRDRVGGEFIIVFDGRCPHARCRFEYVSAEDGYRCPCHGSRFTDLGARISGPARRGLRSLYYEVRDGMLYADLERELPVPTV